MFNQRHRIAMGHQVFVYPLGCFLLMLLLLPGCKKNVEEQDSAPKPADQVQAEPAPEKPAPKKRPNLLKRKTSEVLDKNKAMAENPNLIEVENKITGKDPLTVSLEAYISASSRINVLNFQHQVNLMKAMNDRNPTYQEIVDLIKQTNMQFNALPDYQKFAYDEKEGKFLVLEDPAEKKRIQGK